MREWDDPDEITFEAKNLALTLTLTLPLPLPLPLPLTLNPNPNPTPNPTPTPNQAPMLAPVLLRHVHIPHKHVELVGKGVVVLLGWLVWLASAIVQAWLG